MGLGPSGDSPNFDAFPTIPSHAGPKIPSFEPAWCGLDGGRGERIAAIRAERKLNPGRADGRCPLGGTHVSSRIP